MRKINHALKTICKERHCGGKEYLLRGALIDSADHREGGGGPGVI